MTVRRSSCGSRGSSTFRSMLSGVSPGHARVYHLRIGVEPLLQRFGTVAPCLALLEYHHSGGKDDEYDEEAEREPPLECQFHSSV